jgi:hypothetical protein
VRWATLIILPLICISCAAASINTTGGQIPVSWSLGEADSADGSASRVCEAGDPGPCVLQHGTDQKPKFASFTLNVWGPSPTKFTGYIIATYLNDPDPNHYRSDVDVTSNGKDIHHSLFSKVTPNPGDYSVSIHIEETREGTSPKVHDITVPVIVK